jgi:hypothetical protein
MVIDEDVGAKKWASTGTKVAHNPTFLDAQPPPVDKCPAENSIQTSGNEVIIILKHYDPTQQIIP